MVNFIFFHVQEIRQAAEFLELPQLLMVLGTLQTRDQFNNDLNNRYKQVVRQRLEDICLEQGRILVKNLIQNNYFLFSIIK